MGLVLSNVLVLATPTQVTAGSTAPVSGNYILRVPSGKAPKFAYMGENGKFWLVLRPATAAKQTSSFFVTGLNTYVPTGGH
jgi:Flp pilus assembly protein CpaB